MHVLTVGMTLNGKSVLNKGIVGGLRKLGCGIIVATPIEGDQWDADLLVHDLDHAKEAYQNSRNVHFIWDEAGEFYAEDRKFMQKTATRGRHRGIVNHYIVQRAELLDPTIRGQCSELYLFRVGLDDADRFAKEWGFPELREAVHLPKGMFFHCTTEKGSLEKRKVF